MESQFIPIKKVLDREDNKRNSLVENFCGYYPRYQSFKEHYNYENIKESIECWNKFSNSIGDNLNEVLNNLSVISMNEDINGLNSMTDYIINNIVPVLEQPNFMKNLIKERIRYNNEDSKITESYNSILNSINIINECDRVLRNFENISKRFNITRVMEDGILYKEDGISLQESIHTLCSLVDTYNMNIDSKFCTTTELALLLAETFDTKLDQTSLIESVIDYYLDYIDDLENYAHTIKESAKKDIFIDDSIVLNHINSLLEIKQKLDQSTLTEDYDSYIISKYNSPYDLDDLVDKEYTHLSRSLKSLYESAMFDKAKEAIEKIKLAPVKSITMLKEALRLLFVSNRLQDIKSGTKNGLSLCFYLFVTSAAFIIGGALAGAFAIISSAAISHKADKEYLKNAIQEWKEHRYAVKRKYEACTDFEKKNKIEKYLDQVDHNINLLELEYEKIRDKTSDELHRTIDNKLTNKGTSSLSSDSIDPDGKKIDLDKDSVKDNQSGIPQSKIDQDSGINDIE